MAAVTIHSDFGAQGEKKSATVSSFWVSWLRCKFSLVTASILEIALVLLTKCTFSFQHEIWHTCCIHEMFTSKVVFCIFSLCSCNMRTWRQDLLWSSLNILFFYLIKKNISYWTRVDLQCCISYRGYSKEIQLYIYVYLLFFRFFPIYIITEYWVEFLVLYSRYLLIIYFIYESVFMLTSTNS